MLSCRQDGILGEGKGAIAECLAKVGVGQGPSVAVATIRSDVHHPEAVPGIHNGQEDVSQATFSQRYYGGLSSKTLKDCLATK